MQAGYELYGIAATIDPIDANGANSSSDEIDMQKWSELLVIILLGVLNDSATNTVTVTAATTSGGAFSAMSGKSQAIVGTDDAKQFIIRVTGEEVAAAGKRYVKVTQANSAHSQLMALLVLGKANNPPATDNDLSTVGTIVD